MRYVRTDPETVEAVAERIAADTDEPMWSAIVIARNVLAVVAERLGVTL